MAINHLDWEISQEFNPYQPEAGHLSLPDNSPGTDGWLEWNGRVIVASETESGFSPDAAQWQALAEYLGDDTCEEIRASSVELNEDNKLVFGFRTEGTAALAGHLTAGAAVEAAIKAGFDRTTIKLEAGHLALDDAYIEVNPESAGKQQAKRDALMRQACRRLNALTTGDVSALYSLF